jgi:hypothetical protein
MDAEHTASPAAAPGGQLRLHVGAADRHPEWRLDDETRAVGRRGIAQARAALRSARADHLDERATAGTGSSDAASSRRRTAA